MKAQRKTAFSSKNVSDSGTNEYRVARARILPYPADKLETKSSLPSNRSRKKAEPRLQELACHLINSREDERKQLARELHDDIGQRLALVKIEIEMILLENLSVAAGPAGPRFAAVLAEMEQLGVDVHQLSHSQHSSKLRFLGISAALKDLCQQVQRGHRLSIDLQIEDMSKPVAEDIELCIYRVAQEAFHNITKNSAADHVVLRLIDAGAQLRMEIRDDGKGFNQSQIETGIGLVSMRERLAMVGGALEIRSKPGKGTLLLAQAPFTAVTQHRPCSCLA